MTERIRIYPLVVADNATESDPIDLLSILPPDEALVGIDIPSGFVGTTIGFKNAADMSNYRQVLKDGAAFSLTCAADRFVAIHPADTKGFSKIKLTFASQTGGPITLNLVASTVA